MVTFQTAGLQLSLPRCTENDKPFPTDLTSSSLSHLLSFSERVERLLTRALLSLILTPMLKQRITLQPFWKVCFWKPALSWVSHPLCPFTSNLFLESSTRSQRVLVSLSLVFKFMFHTRLLVLLKENVKGVCFFVFSFSLFF